MSVQLNADIESLRLSVYQPENASLKQIEEIFVAVEKFTMSGYAESDIKLVGAACHRVLYKKEHVF